MLFRFATFSIGFGGGLFAVGMLTAAMDLAASGMSGIALGAWGAVQATSAGLAIAVSGTVRDTISALSEHGTLGPAFAGPDAGYSRRLSDRNLATVCHARRHRTAGPVGPPQLAARRPGFGLAEYARLIEET